jgi:poly(A) polymerase
MKYSLNHPIFRKISECADKLNLPCFVIGGFVRDLILQRESNDIDVVVLGSGIEMATELKNTLGKGTYLSVFKNFGTAQIKHKDIEIEFVGARKESYRRESRKPIVEDGTLEDDQNRRDFTINAMAICLNKDRFGELVDPFNGVRDIELKIIRTPLDPDITFSDDPLRMLRCIRFATRFKFSIEQRTFEALGTNKERISIISQERITEELNKILLTEKPSIGFMLLDKCGLLDIILPEVAALKGVETINGKAHKDVFYHTLQVLDSVAQKSDNLWLRWAALLHDIGKPATKKFDENIGWTFYNHNYIGEKITTKIFKRLKLPLSEELRFVQKIVNLHMRPIALVEDEITDSAVRRLLFEAGDDIDDLMMLCEADITSKNEEKVKRYTQNLHIVRQKLKDIEEKDHVRNFQPPISGEEIMSTFGLTPCAKVGEIKNAIKNAILDGVIPNDYDAAYKYMFSIAEQLGIRS